VTPLVSVIAPVHDEEDVLVEFHRRVVAALEGAGERFELVLVDDGSTDATPALLRELAASDPRVRVVELSRNFGHQLALTAGIDHARGDAVVAIDADLQDPPEVIPAMLERWREGYQVVYGVRTARAGERGGKRLTAHWFYRVVNRLSDVELPPDSGDFRLLDRRVVEVLKGMREDSRYLRGMVAWVGFKQVALPYARDARHAGETKFTWGRMARFALDGITSFSERPLRVAMGLGALVTSTAFLYTAWVVVTSILDPSRSIRGFTSLLAAVLFLGGVQLLGIGVLGMYVGRIFRATKGRPLYVVAETVEGPCPGAERPPPGPAEPPA
jgi:dolichol-phosphate mannosyltransferase